MKEPHGKGVAICPDLESCTCHREVADESWTEASVGWINLFKTHWCWLISTMVVPVPGLGRDLSRNASDAIALITSAPGSGSGPIFLKFLLQKASD